MGRKERRKNAKAYKKLMGKTSLSKGEKELYTKLLTYQHKEKDKIIEGTKVKLKYKEIIKTNPKGSFAEWIEYNKDNIFTVEYEEKYNEKKILCCLKEDETIPKWLVYTDFLEVLPTIETIEIQEENE